MTSLVDIPSIYPSWGGFSFWFSVAFLANRKANLVAVAERRSARNLRQPTLVPPFSQLLTLSGGVVPQFSYSNTWRLTLSMVYVYLYIYTYNSMSLKANPLNRAKLTRGHEWKADRLISPSDISCEMTEIYSHAARSSSRQATCSLYKNVLTAARYRKWFTPTRSTLPNLYQ